MKICYPTPDYKSHRRVACMYRDILGDTHDLLPPERYAEADVVIIHEDPHDYAALYRAFPALAEKYVISYCVWEASEPPEAYKRSFAFVQEIWTCSRYCWQAFAPYHPRVECVPHVIARDVACSPAEMAHVRRAISYDPDNRYYVAIARGWGGRKNLDGLARAFARQARLPEARLVLKVEGRNPPRTFADPRIIWVAEDWTDGQINALYHLAHVYVSAHHGEGWGLTMSDAMLFGKPVIATGYSGNLDFMRPDASWLLAFEEREISEEFRYALYQCPMKWAYPDEEDLGDHLRWMYGAFDTEAIAARVRRASANLHRFNRQEVGRIMNLRLASIASSSYDSSSHPVRGLPV